MEENREAYLVLSEDQAVLSMESCTLAWLCDEGGPFMGTVNIVFARTAGRAHISRSRLMVAGSSRTGSAPEGHTHLGLIAQAQGALVVKRSSLQGCSAYVANQGSLMASHMVIQGGEGKPKGRPNDPAASSAGGVGTTASSAAPSTSGLQAGGQSSSGSSSVGGDGSGGAGGKRVACTAGLSAFGTCSVRLTSCHISGYGIAAAVSCRKREYQGSTRMSRSATAEVA